MEQPARFWQLNIDHASMARFERFYASNPQEYVGLFSNVEKLLGILSGGLALSHCQASFVRSAGDGLVEVSNGAESSGQACRLYLLAHEPRSTIFVLNLGTSETLSDDIKSSKEIARRIREAEQ